MAGRRGKVLVVAGAIVLLVVVAVLCLAIFGGRYVRPRVEAAVSDTLHRQVRIRSARVVFFPAFGIKLRDIRVMDGATEIAKAPEVRVTVKPLALIRRKVEITAVNASRPTVSIVNPAAGASRSKGPGPQDVRSNKPLFFGRVNVSEGSFSYEDVGSGTKLVLAGIDLSLEGFSIGGPSPLRTLACRGEVRCRKLSVAGFTAPDLVLEMRAGGGIINADPFRAGLYGGAGRGTLRADYSGPAPRFQAASTVRGLDIGDLIGLSSGRIALRGKGDLSVSLSGSGPTWNGFVSSLEGGFSLDGQDIVLEGLDLDTLLPSLERSRNFNLLDLGGFFMAGPLGEMAAKGHDFSEIFENSRGGRGVIRRLVSVWDVRKGVAKAVDVAMATSEHRIAMDGGLDFGKGRFEDVNVAVVDRRGCAVFSQGIRGSFGAPKIEEFSAIRSMARPMTHVLESLERAVTGGKCRPFYRGSVAAPENQKRP